MGSEHSFPSFGSIVHSDSNSSADDVEEKREKVGAAEQPQPQVSERPQAPPPSSQASDHRRNSGSRAGRRPPRRSSSDLLLSSVRTTTNAAGTNTTSNTTNHPNGDHGGANSNVSISLVDHSFRLLSLLTVAVWLTLLSVVYTVAPRESMVVLEGWERTAPTIAFAVLLVGTLSWILPLLYRGNGLSGSSRGGEGLSGILVGGLTVQCIALLTELFMATIPTPVMYDPVTGTKVHLLRWCEWTPLAFLMTYLTEATDVPKGGREGWKSLRVPLLHGACQGLSTLCGLIFPFCHGVIDWTLWMILSCLLFVVIYFRLAYKRRAFQGMDKGTTVDDIETYARGRLSLGLLWTCTVMWSVLVLAYFVYSLVPLLYADAANEDRWFHPTGSLTMISEAALDVLLKVVYMKIIVNVHDTVFDDAARAERRLKELREMMSVVWDSSSDVIVVSVRGAKGVVTTMVSPTYVSIFPKNKGEEKEDGNDGTGDDAGDDTDEKRNGLVFEFNPKDYSDDGRGLADAMPSSLQVHDLEFFGLSSVKSKAADEVVRTEGMSSLVELVFRAWDVSADKITGGSTTSSPSLPTDTASASAPEDVIISPRLNSADPAGRWEAKITRLRDSALVMVLRDTSERSRRFEAEKKYVSESTARMKDAEANRFTRHEVKNGLLSAIGLCDSFGDTLEDIMKLQEGIEAAKAAAAKAADESHLVIDAPNDVRIIDPSTTVCLHELDRTLNEVLHMVLADAMAREIVHDVFEPRWEYADVLGCLSSHHHLRGFQSLSLSDRFPIIVRPSPMSRMRCDLQLLSLIHRSAISNACKFGKKGGQVLTEVHFLKDDGPGASGVLEMRVTNLPGPNHDLLLEMGSVGEDLVFAKGGALRTMLARRGAINVRGKASSNGAWIVQKGARVMGGVCNMRFLPDKTEFTLRFPTDIAKEGEADDAGDETPKERFRIPDNTWGIAIDDSKIQRKLLERFLQYAGVRKDRIIVLGKDTTEIEGFVDFVSDFLDQHPNDHIFIIADENLDVVLDDAHHTTVSGSLCIESIRKRILPDQERRMLALVRSANDSANDVAIYNSRAHGFLPKAPLQRDKIPDMISPLWEKRYPKSLAKSLYESKGSDEDIDEGYDSEIIISRSDLRQSVIAIEKIVAGLEEADLSRRWGMIWEKLHALKGDMLTYDSGDEVRQVVYQINSLRGRSLPPNFMKRWAGIKKLAEKAIAEGVE